MYFDVSANSVGLFLQGAAGLLDLLVLAFHLGVLLGELLGLEGEFLVGLLQFLLLTLQFAGQRLRLLQQALGAHRRFDGVEDDADRFGQLIEEQEVRRLERRQGRQLDDRFALAFEQHRQHDDAARRRLEGAGGDADGVGGTSLRSRRFFSTPHCPTNPSPSRYSPLCPGPVDGHSRPADFRRGSSRPTSSLINGALAGR